MTAYIHATWIADVLRRAVTVEENHGWKDRGRPPLTGGFVPRAVMWHHDGSEEGPSPGSPAYILAGRPPDDPGPLAQCWVAKDGTWHVIASGRCNHGGYGIRWGVIPQDDANTYSIGVETDHTVGEPWPDKQLDSLRAGTAALLTYLDADPNDALVGHKEYAPTRKVDPAGLNMGKERSRVAALMEGDTVNQADIDKIVKATVDGVFGHRVDNRATGSTPTFETMVETTHRNTVVAAGAVDADRLADAIADKLNAAPAGNVKQAVIDGIRELVAGDA